MNYKVRIYKPDKKRLKDVWINDAPNEGTAMLRALDQHVDELPEDAPISELFLSFEKQLLVIGAREISEGPNHVKGRT